MLEFPFGEYKFKVKSYHTDQNGKLTLPSLFHLLQECAWDNARANNFGFEDLEKQNAFWVLSKIYLEINQYPNWKDEISIKTWPKGVDGLFAIRDFQISLNGEVVGNVTSYWMILDKTSARPKRLNEFNFIHENFLNESAIDHPIGKLETPTEIKEIEHRKVYYSDLDVNKHVNNGTYVRWILDSYFSENNELIKRFEINFLQELKLNDNFSIQVRKEPAQVFYLLKNAKGRDICKALIK